MKKNELYIKYPFVNLRFKNYSESKHYLHHHPKKLPGLTSEIALTNLPASVFLYL